MASQTARIFYIDHKIRVYGRVTLNEIIENFGVSVITVKRDIESMRVDLNAPIIYSHKLRAYQYSNEFKLLDFAGEQILLFYLFATNLIKNPHFIPLTAEYAREIIIEKLKELYLEDFKDIIDNFRYDFPDYESVDVTILQTVIESMKNGVQCSLTYLTKGKDSSERIIDPLKVICYGGRWYLAAYCNMRKELRVFSFSRMEKLEIIQNSRSDKNRIPNGVIDEYFDNSFGIAKSPQIKKAKIRFYEPSSYLIRKQIWHKEQKVTELKVNEQYILELELPYGKPEELTGKVLKYSDTAEIISPPELRSFWLGEIKKMAEKWTKSN